MTLHRIRLALADLAARLGRSVPPEARASAEAAAPVESLDLAATFRDPAIETAWTAAERRIAVLGLSSEGGMNPGDRRALYYLIRRLRPERVLEIGTLAGASTVHLAAGLADAWAESPARRLLTVDIVDVNDSERAAWRRLGLAQSPRQAMERLGLGALVEFRTARSLELLAQPGEAYDLIFLDGDHRLETVVVEIPAALARLRPGGLLLLHDYFPDLRSLWPDGKVIDGPARAVRRLQRAGWPIAVQPLGELPWPTKQGTRWTSLAVLGRS
ncbi:MAG TPA: class I SAM-dependent methyltransferase [Gemmatimonadales bacterium]|nr:class I SAM-dependent methyltransferase [Gemmatimonadales bacterium]